MKERFLREGIEHFEPHNVLELLLFYSIPQKDTNETAHKLIERFGSLSAVFDAPFSELIKIEGVKEHSATLIKLIPELAKRYVSETGSFSGTFLPTVDDVGKYFKSKYIGVTKETVYLLLLDNKYKVIDCIKIHEGSVNSSAITMRKLIEAAIETKASFAVLAHNHPGGIALPSSDDIFTTRETARAFTLIGVDFLAHILVAGDKYIDILNY
jgi:DNA repair protein RadC